MDHGDGNMQRWKRGATREQLRMALDGVRCAAGSARFIEAIPTGKINLLEVAIV